MSKHPVRPRPLSDAMVARLRQLAALDYDKAITITPATEKALESRALVADGTLTGLGRTALGLPAEAAEYRWHISARGARHELRTDAGKTAGSITLRPVTSADVFHWFAEGERGEALGSSFFHGDARRFVEGATDTGTRPNA